jgi:hypothetical protein
VNVGNSIANGGLIDLRLLSLHSLAYAFLGGYPPGGLPLLSCLFAVDT